MGRRKVDWSEVEPLYRANVLSVAEIARQFGITSTAIFKHANQHKWKRDLATMLTSTRCPAFWPAKRLSILTDCGLAGSCYNFKMIRGKPLS
jgi:hypothetical protein